MKITEKTQHQDGTSSTREFQMSFSKGRSQVCYTLVPDTDDPLCVKILESGWRDGGPLFHVLIEYGDFMQTDYRFLSLEQICETWPEFRSVWQEFATDVLVSSAELRSITNDMELGKWTRDQSCKTTESRKDFHSHESVIQLKLDL